MEIISLAILGFFCKFSHKETNNFLLKFYVDFPRERDTMASETKGNRFENPTLMEEVHPSLRPEYSVSILAFLFFLKYPIILSQNKIEKIL